MSVLLIPNPTKDTGLAVTRQAAAVLAGLGVPVLMPQPFANEFGSAGLTGVHFLPEADAYRAADQVVTIGGDGTLLRAGLSCMKHGKPRSGRQSWPHRLSGDLRGRRAYGQAQTAGRGGVHPCQPPSAPRRSPGPRVAG